MKREREYVAYLQMVYPTLQIESTYINEIGQNNDLVNTLLLKLKMDKSLKIYKIKGFL
ncbi:hypothetical protein QMA02_00930 [Bacillus wiedmannii]|uniref:hypothetical protein n=1 Tax=Bacillus wiedmannii TaxID=1890302 RepID=UPI0024AE035E|nr:hypothetical protein [Bacillus wiedmannii]MDI6674424.1 hypothetical protein [Bacillus wiedmannii]